MLDIIFLIIFSIGFLGILFLVLKNFSNLVSLPEKEFAPVNVKNMVSSIKNNSSSVPFDNFLQKFLARLRILILKSDNKTFKWMQSLRKKSEDNRFEDDNYWKNLKKRNK